METHERLAESDRHLRCTAMDALEVLRKRAGFQDDDQTQFQIGLMRLPSGDKVGLIDIRFNSSAHKTVYCVSLPTATHFNAIQFGFSVSRRLEVSLLDQTLIDSRGRVRLKDGRLLRALEIEPARLPLEPSNLEDHPKLGLRREGRPRDLAPPDALQLIGDGVARCSCGHVELLRNRDQNPQNLAAQNACCRITPQLTARRPGPTSRDAATFQNSHV